jgi:hypothetical protein
MGVAEVTWTQSLEPFGGGVGASAAVTLEEEEEGETRRPHAFFSGGAFSQKLSHSLMDFW